MNGAANGANQRWKRIPVNTTGVLDADLDFGNGLGTPRPVDTNNDGVVDLVYAGDKKGNLWRFNVRDLNNVVVTKIYKTPSAVAVTGQQPVAQSINNAPVVRKFGGAGTCPASQAADCWMVVFGTGDDLNPLTTSNSMAPQTLYGLFDKGEIGATALITDTNLVDQTITANASAVGSVGTISNNAVAYATGKRGWRMQLTLGEHATSGPELQVNGSVMFATSRPAGMAVTSCAPGAGWLTQLNMATGAGKDNAFKNSTNNTTGARAVVNDGTGIYAAPNTLLGSTLNSRTHKLLISGFAGNLGASNLNNSLITQSTDIMVGRMSWREVFNAPR